MDEKDLRIELDIGHCMDSPSGVGPEHGLSEEDIQSAGKRGRELVQLLAEQRSRGELPYRDLPYQFSQDRNDTKDDTDEEAKEEEQSDDVRKAALEKSKQFDNVVVLGIGGSALGTMAVA